jgi:competence protein ComEC
MKEPSSEHESLLQTAIDTKANITLTGTLYKRSEKSTYQQLYLKNVILQLDTRSITLSKLLVFDTTYPTLAIGNRLKVHGTLSTFDCARNPGNFDAATYYQRLGFSYRVWSNEISCIDATTFAIREQLDQLRCAWNDMLTTCLGSFHGGTLAAMLLGEKGELDESLKLLFQKTGIGHILAISGLHMSFLGIGLYQILRKCGASFGFAGFLGSITLFLYTIFVGAGVSSIRACAMFAVKMGAEMTGRHYDLPTSLSFAAACIVASNPWLLWDSGFLLSFGALLGVALVIPALKLRCNKLLIGLLASLALQLVLLPLTLLFYYEFCPYSILLNLIVIPLMSPLLALAMIGSLLSLVSLPLATYVFYPCKWILSLYELLCHFTLKLPFARVVTGKPTVSVLILYYLFLFGICIVIHIIRLEDRGFLLSCKQFFLLLTSLCLLLVVAIESPKKKNQLQVTMLDVGQGDCFYIKDANGGCYLVDGGSSDISDVGIYRIAPYLESQGVGTLDAVFLSHGDLDHVSGIRELLANQTLYVRIKTLVLPTETVWDDTLTELASLALASGTNVVTMERGDVFQHKEFSITCLSPSSSYVGEIGNASSMCLELRYRNFSMLFTGDIEGTSEDELCEQTDANYSILKVAHHGSNNSTTDTFLASTTAPLAWISAGVNNRYGHPGSECVTRLTESGATLFATNTLGAVWVVTDGEQLFLHTFFGTTQ